MDPSMYYNTWWNNHNTANNWYMDPHKNGTSAVNPPPPAHNMSGPPQHSSAHGMPMAQPIPPRPMQPSYMSPRPAHTGSSIPFTKTPQLSTISPKQPHSGSSSPKPTMTSPSSQEKLTPTIDSIKPFSASVPMVANSPSAANTVKFPVSSLEVNSGLKSIHNLPASNFHQMQHQPLPQNSVSSQSNPGQPINIPQQLSAAQQPTTTHLVPSHQAAVPANVQQTQPIQQQNLNALNKPTPQNQDVSNAKQEIGKCEKPPVPDLISIKQPPPTSVPTSNEKNVADVKATTLNNSVASTAKPQNVNNGNIPTNEGEQISDKSPDQHKIANVSILPAKSPAINPKSISEKSLETTNTVTITPSTKPLLGQIKNNEQQTNNDSLGPNQNGVQLTKSDTKPTEEKNIEIKVPIPPKSTLNQPSITKPNNQTTNSSPVKQSSPVVNLNSDKNSSIAKHASSKPLTSPSHNSPQKAASSVVKTPVVQQIPAQPPHNSPQKNSTIKANTSVSPTKSDENEASSDSASPSKTDTKVDSVIPAQDKTVNSTTSSVKDLIVKKSAGKTPKAKPIKETECEEELSDEEKPLNTPKRGRRSKRSSSLIETPVQEGERKSKRSRNPASVYQSPIVEPQTRIPKSLKVASSTPDRLVVFFKNEHVALRNADGTFYICQLAQNVYKSTKKIKIRWLSPIDESDAKCEIYKADYYDITDFDCILTNIAMKKAENGCQRLPEDEKDRILNILNRAMDRDKGIEQEKSELREDHPDGLDVSLYNDESQLKEKKKRGRKRKVDDEESEEDEDEEEDDENNEEEQEEEEEDEKEEVEEEEEKIEEPEAKKKPGRKRAGRQPSVRATKPPPTKKATPAGTRGRPSKSTPVPPTPPSVDSSPVSKPTPASRRKVRNFSSARAAAAAAAASASDSPAQTPQSETPKETKRSGRSTRGSNLTEQTKRSQSPAVTPKTTRRSRK